MDRREYAKESRDFNLESARRERLSARAGKAIGKIILAIGVGSGIGLAVSEHRGTTSLLFAGGAVITGFTIRRFSESEAAEAAAYESMAEPWEREIAEIELQKSV